jgi:hypothetical protein
MSADKMFEAGHRQALNAIRKVGKHYDRTKTFMYAAGFAAGVCTHVTGVHGARMAFDLMDGLGEDVLAHGKLLTTKE